MEAIPPINGFEEMILLTNQGKLWNFPIDNEQGKLENKFRKTNIKFFKNFSF